MATNSTLNNTRLFVSGLYDGINEQDIRNHFEAFGSITDIYILRNKKKKSRGCCFIGFINKTQTLNALKQCNKTYLGTRRISVTIAQNKTQNNTTKTQQNSIKIASSSNNNNNNNKEFEQFVRLTKSSANISHSDDIINEFLDNDSDDSESVNDLDEVQSNVKEIKQHNESINNAQSNKTNNIISNHQVNEIFIRNLPFATTDEDLYSFFTEFGNISEVFIPLDDFGKAKGYGYVQFENNECIQTLFRNYKNNMKNDMISTTFNGRNVDILLSNYKYKETHLINGRELCFDDLDDELKSNLSFKELRDLKLKHNAKNDISWNSLFIPNDNILRYNAKQLNVTKAQLLDVNTMQNNMAITTTVAETAVISKTKTFLAQNGIDLKQFNQQKSETIRSRNIILVKNFAFNTTQNELKILFAKYGEISRCLLPETKSCAIIEFVHVKHAKKAFHNLSYSKLKHLPLFLEFAPINVFCEEKKKEDEGDQDADQDVLQFKEKRGRKRKRKSLSDGDDETKSKVIVKNIPFETTKQELMKLFAIYGNVKSLRLPAKYGGGHRGFCFIEFETHKEALNVFDALSSSHFYGRHLVIEWAKNEEQSAKRTRIE